MTASAVLGLSRTLSDRPGNLSARTRQLTSQASEGNMSPLPVRQWIPIALCLFIAMVIGVLTMPGLTGVAAAESEDAAQVKAHQTAGLTSAGQRESMSTQQRYRTDRKYAKVMSIARHQIGDPYRYGAAGPNAFDCSGLVLYVYRKALGINLQHLATAEYRRSTPIKRSQVRRGDLVFFHSGKNIYHAAIFAGHHRVLHAPQPGQRVQIDPIWTKSVWFGRLIPKG